MGIDVYLSWKGMTKADRQAQYTGFDTASGNLGYLREAYHGEPYGTPVLVPECFDEDRQQKRATEDDPIMGIQIPAATMRERLPAALEAVGERARNVYKLDEDRVKEAQLSFTQFVELAELKEAETGEPCWVYSSY